jgi:hypothetical protein
MDTGPMACQVTGFNGATAFDVVVASGGAGVGPLPPRLTVMVAEALFSALSVAVAVTTYVPADAYVCCSGKKPLLVW